MSVVYSTTLKNTRMDAVTTAAGTTAVLEICSASYASVLVSFTLNNPIAASSSSGVLTLSGFPKTVSTPGNAGTAVVARIRTATGGTTVLDGLTVGTSGADIILGTVSILTTVPVTINSAVITHG